MKTKRNFDLIIQKNLALDKELEEGINMITTNEGITMTQLNQFFEEGVNEFEAKVSYELARQAVIVDLVKYSNVAVAFGLIMVTFVIHLINLVMIGEPVSYDFSSGRMFSY